MNNKIIELKDTIYQLYCKEGRSAVYISNLLKINRSKLGKQLKEWGFEKANVKRCKPSTQKFINKNKDYIIARLKEGISIKDIEISLGVSRNYLFTLFQYDKDLENARQQYKDNLNKKHIDSINRLKEESSYVYNIEDLDGEEWKPILGYEGYEISNKGRVKHYSSRLKDFHLLTLYPNSISGRLYVTLSSKEKRENLQVARLVAFNFCKGHSETNNTVNHIDGDISNNTSENLEWVSQSENNIHAYDVLGRPINVGMRNRWIIVYDNKYKFKSIAAYARFIGKSETQARRYMDEPEKHNIKVIDKKLV